MTVLTTCRYFFKIYLTGYIRMQTLEPVQSTSMDTSTITIKGIMPPIIEKEVY